MFVRVKLIWNTVLRFIPYRTSAKLVRGWFNIILMTPFLDLASDVWWVIGPEVRYWTPMRVTGFMTVINTVITECLMKQVALSKSFQIPVYVKVIRIFKLCYAQPIHNPWKSGWLTAPSSSSTCLVDNQSPWWQLCLRLMIWQNNHRNTNLLNNVQIIPSSSMRNKRSHIW